MHTTVNLSEFRSAFHNMDRKENFSYEGLEVLYNHLEQYEEDAGEQIELDVIALCCDYTEESIEDALSNYSLDDIGVFRDQTIVLDVNDTTIIYQNY